MAISPLKATAISVRLDRKQANEVDRLAARDREARSVIVRRLLKNGLKQERRVEHGDEAA